MNDNLGTIFDKGFLLVDQLSNIGDWHSSMRDIVSVNQNIEEIALDAEGLGIRDGDEL